MLNALRLQISNPGIPRNCERNAAAAGRLGLRLPARRNFASYTVQSFENVSSVASVSSSQLISTVGSSPSQWALTLRHSNVLSYIACAAFKRAAESMEKLMDVTREELPQTMIAVRLSGMEISDLTMELSDLGQGITRGSKSATRAARLAEEKTVFMQEAGPTGTGIPGPALARTARGVREGIVRGRAVLQMFFTLTRFSKMLMNYFKSRVKA
ncbi:hypothetical protein BUALT_Bualt11G0010700 [Buddleja alternifolia]|uniref:Uncharacterized protein n=1 Tax=Buddleja alternifolia TaxID=168488 RepID=A0AAV6WWK9_9LAMI|nr:hypothetical protein BUALT_Bualt11G0010700 [Buddleja alternifolia]